MDTKDIIKKLTTNKCPEKQAPLVAEELSHLDERLVALLKAWVEDNKETDFEVEHYSIRDFMEKHAMTYPAALLTIDWLIKEPTVAKEAISQGIK